MGNFLLLAPAKINLILKLLGKRRDGFHLIESLMVPVDLCDQIEVEFDTQAEDELSVESDSQDASSGIRNLVYRAADLLRRRTQRRFALSARLRKNIPVGSGLGGGSSDAATILRFLNHQLGYPLTLPELAMLGAEIGADVPFFIFGCPAIVTGIGEIVEPISGVPGFHLVLCSPDVILPTASVYAEADRSLTTQRPESNIAGFVVRRKPIEEWLANDLEAAAARICPEVRTLKRKLLDLGALGASMTGSGSTVFGICRDEPSAQRMAEALRREGRWSRVTRALARSPGMED